MVLNFVVFMQDAFWYLLCCKVFLMTAQDDTTKRPSYVQRATDAGSAVPLKWRPTPAAPVPVVRCTAIKKNGERCGRWSLRGTVKCIVHGGQLPVVQQHADAVVEAARLRLIGATDAAVDQIVDLMENATAEGIRLKAAQDVLDRAGVKGPVEIDLTVTQAENPAARIAQRLGQISARIVPSLTPPIAHEDVSTPSEDGSDIVDAEVVSEE